MPEDSDIFVHSFQVRWCYFIIIFNITVVLADFYLGLERIAMSDTVKMHRAMMIPH